MGSVAKTLAAISNGPTGISVEDEVFHTICRTSSPPHEKSQVVCSIDLDSDGRIDAAGITDITPWSIEEDTFQTGGASLPLNEKFDGTLFVFEDKWRRYLRRYVTKEEALSQGTSQDRTAAQQLFDTGVAQAKKEIAGFVRREQQRDLAVECEKFATGRPFSPTYISTFRYASSGHLVRGRIHPHLPRIELLKPSSFLIDIDLKTQWLGLESARHVFFAAARQICEHETFPIYFNEDEMGVVLASTASFTSGTCGDGPIGGGDLESDFKIAYRVFLQVKKATHDGSPRDETLCLRDMTGDQVADRVGEGINAQAPQEKHKVLFDSALWFVEEIRPALFDALKNPASDLLPFCEEHNLSALEWTMKAQGKSAGVRIQRPNQKGELVSLEVTMSLQDLPKFDDHYPNGGGVGSATISDKTYLQPFEAGARQLFARNSNLCKPYSQKTGIKN